MISDGERLKVLLARANRRVVLCSPFIKAKVLEAVLSVIADAVHVRIVTRWRTSEIALGVSDLDVFEIANSRTKTELALLNDLHAKIYVSDDDCLVGSANLTASALGWSEPSNVELLVPARIADPDVRFLLQRLDLAEAATFAQRSEMAAAAAAFDVKTVDEGREIAAWCTAPALSWLPRCAAPDRLYEIYLNPETDLVAKGTQEDGLADLRDMKIHGGLSLDSFGESVRGTLRSMPGVERILDEIPRGVTDAHGVELVEATRPDLVGSDAREQWRIVRDWIGVFFGEEFEVAPESFVTRLKTR